MPTTLPEARQEWPTQLAHDGLAVGAGDADERHAAVLAGLEQLVDDGFAHRARLADGGLQVHQKPGSGVDLDDHAALLRERAGDVLADHVDASDVEPDDPRGRAPPTRRRADALRR